MNTKSGRTARLLGVGVTLCLAGLSAGTTPGLAQQAGGAVGLTSLARSALDTNRDLVAAREAYVTAQEQVSEAWSNVMPSVDFNASYTRNIAVPQNFLPAAIFDPTAGPDDYIGVNTENTNSNNLAGISNVILQK